MKTQAYENDDPLRRIQAEIDAIAVRERELHERIRQQQERELSRPAEHVDAKVSLTSDKVKPPLVRTVSTPQVNVSNSRPRLASQKSWMQRFIASRGKLLRKTSTDINSNEIVPSSRDDIPAHDKPRQDVEDPYIPPPDAFYADFDPPVIERDANGRPIRPGYIPAIEKIQEELRDLKIRERELKRLRKRLSRPDSIHSIEDEEIITDDSDNDDDDDSNIEHCYSPDRWRKCSITYSMTTDPQSKITSSPVFDRKQSVNCSLRNARSLAQLCDLNPDEAPSSHQLIDKWEKLIQNHV